MALRNNLKSEKAKERYDRNFNSVETTFSQKELEEHDKEVRAKAIDEFAEKLNTDVESFVAEVDGVRADLLTLDYFSEFVFEIAEQLKGVQEC